MAKQYNIYRYIAIVGLIYISIYNGNLFYNNINEAETTRVILIMIRGVTSILGAGLLMFSKEQYT